MASGLLGLWHRARLQMAIEDNALATVLQATLNLYVHSAGRHRFTALVRGVTTGSSTVMLDVRLSSRSTKNAHARLNPIGRP